MSEVASMIQRAKEIRQRLLNPPNAVKDYGIDLKRKQIPPKAPPTPLQDKLVRVLEYQALTCNVTVTALSPEPKVLKFKPILKAVSTHYGVPIPTIQGESRQKFAVFPRHVAWYIASLHTGLSMAAIGRRSARDHTTVLHALVKIRRRLLWDSDLASVIQMLENELFAGKYDDHDFNRPAVASQPQPDMAEQGQPSLQGP